MSDDQAGQPALLDPTPELSVLAWPGLFPVAVRGRDGTLRNDNTVAAEVSLGVALLALRDAGAVTMENVTANVMRESLSRLRHGKTAFQLLDARAARTHVVVTPTGAGGVPEGLAGQLLGNLKKPVSVSDLVYAWLKETSPSPEEHVLRATRIVACDRGYYRIVSREGTGLVSRHLKAKQFFEPIDERVASMHDIAAAVAARWLAFAEQEPELHVQLLTDVARGIKRRVTVDSDD